LACFKLYASACFYTAETFYKLVSGVNPQPILETDANPQELPRGQETILLVDDETPLRVLLIDLFQRCGFKVLPAASGAAALEIWAKHKDQIDLVLTDVEMPDMTGLVLAKTLRRERADVEVIYMSGFIQIFPTEEMALDEEMNFISKPFNPFKLAQLVRARLDHPSSGRISPPPPSSPCSNRADDGS